MEEAFVFGVAELLEQRFVLVAVVLRRLHHGDLRIGEVRHHVLEPVAFDAVVGVDHRDHLSVGSGVLQHVVQRAALEAGQRRDVEELEARAEAGAVGFHRLPDRRVLGVVVDHQDLEVRVVEARQGVEGLFDHLRRLVVAGHVDRHLGPVGVVAGHRREGPHALVLPHGFRQLVGLGEQDDHHAQGADGQQDADQGAEPVAVLLAVVVGDPHQHGAGEERDNGQEGAPALAQRAAVDQQQGQGEQGEHAGGGGQQAPLRDFHHRAGERELGLALGVEHAPVGTDRAFVAGLPRLVESFDDEVVVALGVQLVDQGAQVDGLVGLGRLGAATGAAVARPADFRQQQRLLGEHLPQLAGALENEVDRVFLRHEFPVGQHVGGDQVDVLGQLRILLPDMPLLGGGHRYLERRAHAVQVADHLLDGDFLAEHGFVADHHAHDAALALGDLDAALDLPLVGGLVVAQPDAQGHAQAGFLGQARDFAEHAIDRVGADVVGLSAQQLEVGTHLVLARIGAVLRALVQAERREGVAGNLVGPVRCLHRLVEPGPQAGEQGGHGHDHDQVETQFASRHVYRVPGGGTGGEGRRTPMRANPTLWPLGCIGGDTRAGAASLTAAGQGGSLGAGGRRTYNAARIFSGVSCRSMSSVSAALPACTAELALSGWPPPMWRWSASAASVPGRPRPWRAAGLARFRCSIWTMSA
ncbi:hypothetical protein D3C75_596920 [compost metagenome]